MPNDNSQRQYPLPHPENIAVTDVRILKFGNVLFRHGIKRNRRIVHDFLDRIGIHYIGRFGEWNYLWSDQSLLSGRDIGS